MHPWLPASALLLVGGCGPRFEIVPEHSHDEASTDGGVDESGAGDDSDGSGETGEPANHCVGPEMEVALGPVDYLVVSPDGCQIAIEKQVTLYDLRLDVVWLDGEEAMPVNESGSGVGKIAYGPGTDVLAYIDTVPKDWALTVRGQYGRGEPTVLGIDVHDFQWTPNADWIVYLKSPYDYPSGRTLARRLDADESIELSQQAILLATDVKGGVLMLEHPNQQSTVAYGDLIWGSYDGMTRRVISYSGQLHRVHGESGRVLYNSDGEQWISYIGKSRPEASLPLVVPDDPDFQWTPETRFTPDARRAVVDWVGCDWDVCTSSPNGQVINLDDDPPTMEAVIASCSTVLDFGVLCHTPGPDEIVLRRFDGTVEVLASPGGDLEQISDDTFLYEVRLPGDPLIGNYEAADLHVLELDGPFESSTKLVRKRTRHYKFSPTPDGSDPRWVFTRIDGLMPGEDRRGVMNLDNYVHAVLLEDVTPYMVVRNGAAVIYYGASVGPMP